MPQSLAVPPTDVTRVQRDFPAVPRVAIVAGSGLGGLAARVEDAVAIPYSELDGFPNVGNVVGHSGELVCGSLAGVPVVVFAGRAHRYQGVSALDAAYPARLAAALGAEVLVLTNAAGGIAEDLHVGDVVLLSDHVNLTGDNPLVGWPGPEGGNPFVPMSDTWDAQLRSIALDAAPASGLTMREGVYFGLLGPSYETPAEVRMLRLLGADVVGMSTVMEAIVARAFGLRLLGMSLVTNAAAGEGLSHSEVLDVGARSAVAMEGLLTAIIARI